MQFNAPRYRLEYKRTAKRASPSGRRCLDRLRSFIDAIWTTLGRASLGLWAASQSRYVTENLLILVGCYLCLLERWPARNEVSFTAGVVADATRSSGQIGSALRERRRRGLVAGLRVVAIILIVVGVVGGIENGITNGGGQRRLFQLDDLVAAHAADAPDSLLKSALFPSSDFHAINVRQLAEAAKKNQLSFFATSEASRLARASLPRITYVPPKTSVAKPTDGAVLQGRQYLVANMSSDYPIMSADFQIRDSGGQQVERLSAHRFLYGWLGIFVTTNLPNGSYTVQSTARDSTGRSSTSQAVQITIDN